MRGKWNSNDLASNRHSTIPRIGETGNLKLKHLQHSPSLKALKTYNDLAVEGNFHSDIDLRLYTPRKYDVGSVSSMSLNSDVKSNDHNVYECIRSGAASAASANTSEMGSTLKLVPSKARESCQTVLYYISTALCTVSMALGLGNLYRLPQTTMIRGGLPFLIAHLILTIFIGLPLLFLELGIGQMAQEGFIKSWRIIPFFRGIGYVKFLAGYMLSIYYPLYMSISLYYVIWIWKGSIPFQECSTGVKITEAGYSHYGKTGQECLRSTFLKSAFEDPSWYGIFVAILLVIWTLSAFLTIGKTKSYVRSLTLLCFPTLACHVALFVKSMLLQTDLVKFFTDADWNYLTSANVWYYASIQIFFSSTVGFGSFVTNAGFLYNKVNPFWTALGYCGINVLFGLGSTIVSQSLSNHASANFSSNRGDIGELFLVSLVYDIGSTRTDSDKKIWIILIFALFILSGFISMATLTYTLLKAITVGTKARLKWWQASIILCVSGFVFGCAVLLVTDFDVVHLLDHYIVGNLILITSILEVLTILAFYGVERIKSDFEFMLGHILSKIWLVLWWLAPIILTLIFAWGMIVLPLEGVFKDDPPWLYGVGWGVVLTSSLLIFIIGLFVVTKHDGYTFIERFKSSLKPSNNWGPKDPISRHNWIQWNTKAKSGERDFTLKRKGTKDYTKSIKKNKKILTATNSPQGPRGMYKETSDKDTVYNNNNELRGAPKSNNHKNDAENGKFHLISLTDTLNHNHQYKERPQTQNPLARREIVLDEYGTFRNGKGPYVIPTDTPDHVCFRKISEDATEL
ncbi:unnamed protein product [Phyllotreta striolata]|uniref:Uncharacterized protein n=1 Tax=Phyllotreta striolata TaxID=444603 RepID=A0A9N9TL22_PHYSR|nr:unnamed protein product [Phyllotreta striolata]